MHYQEKEKLTSSIAMTTYNGEKFILLQLQSIYNQSRKVDEVLICDDQSTDNTVQIIRDFISANRLEQTWKINVNEISKGIKKNFLECANISNGDVIFYADQDDIWDLKKVEKMMEVFENKRDVLALTCTCYCINESGQKFNRFYTYFKYGINRGDLRRIELNQQVRENNCSGLTLAQRKCVFKKLYSMILQSELEYDLPVGLFTSVTGNFFCLDEPLVYHRIHKHNYSSPKCTFKERIKNIEFQIEGRKSRLRLLKKLLKEVGNQLNSKELTNLKKNILSIEKSIIALNKGNITMILKQLRTQNPMENRKINFINLLCVCFHDYSNDKTN